MGGFCRSCTKWTQSPALRSAGYCSVRRNMFSSLDTCGAFEPQPISFTGKMSGSFAAFWERWGSSTWDAATASRKTLEMMIIMTMILVAFAYMMIKVFPAAKNAMFGAFSPPAEVTHSAPSEGGGE